MRNLKQLIILFAAAIFMLGCNKNQKVVRQLDGEWRITEIKYNGVSDDSYDFSNDRYIFEKCKVNKGDCPGKLKTIDPTKGETTFAFTYSITEKGTKITIKLDVFGITDSSTGDILEHSKEKFVWSVKDEDGDVTETIIEKVN